MLETEVTVMNSLLIKSLKEHEERFPTLSF